MDDLIGREVRVTDGPYDGATGTVTGQIRGCCRIELAGIGTLYLWPDSFEVS
jgi:transcription elongation factor